MAGIDITSIQNAISDPKSALVKLSLLLIKKTSDNENLIKLPLENLLKQIPTDGTCPDPQTLQNIIDKRNNIVEFLNKFSTFLDTVIFTYTGVSVAFDVALSTITGLKLTKTTASGGVKILPTAPGFVTALLSDLGDLTDNLTYNSLGESKLVKRKQDLDTLAIALNIVSSFVKNVVTILNSLDAALSLCLQPNQTLNPVSDNLQKILTDNQQSVDNSTYQGFIFKIEEVPFSSTVTRRKAVAFNQSGIPLIETPLSFTTNDRTLIDELKLIIDRDNLKAY
jgi:hypothetical protein